MKRPEHSDSILILTGNIDQWPFVERKLNATKE